MVFSFWNTVRLVVPRQPIEFRDKATDESVTVQRIIEEDIPEFRDGARQLFHPLYFTGLLQTFATFSRNARNVDIVWYRRLMLNYEDGGVGALDFVTPHSTWEKYNLDDMEIPETQKNSLGPFCRYFTTPEIDALPSADEKPILLYLHGLTGGSQGRWVRHTVKLINEKYGFEACVLNHRGCGYSTITTPRLFNALSTNDLRTAVNKLRSLYPNRKIYLMATSFGSSLVINYLGQEGSKSEISCAVVLGTLWDFSASQHSLKRNKLNNKVVGNMITRNLVAMVKEHLDELLRDPNMVESYKKLDTVTTFEEYDNEFTAKIFGYNTSFEYYRHASCVNQILQVRTPLICLNSLDDPLVPAETSPHREVDVNPYLLLVETTKGGHVGWITPNGTRWGLESVCKLFAKFQERIVAHKLTADMASVVLPTPVYFDN
ncbi:HEL143Cp [Eremothecium sinecaudum]|uniref:HEL143Cp n=1 Tax=Eremothecium sinecaudum TaxID=45286 RepID=A0A120K2C7_9SACH|nr:HEL143Cp [Eremothecium sinecaudum]AMD21138.1 HEL143Cp [Eremothecium sinecaudum]